MGQSLRAGPVARGGTWAWDWGRARPGARGRGLVVVGGECVCGRGPVSGGVVVEAGLGGKPRTCGNGGGSCNRGQR